MTLDQVSQPTYKNDYLVLRYNQNTCYQTIAKLPLFLDSKISLEKNILSFLKRLQSRAFQLNFIKAMRN